MLSGKNSLREKDLSDYEGPGQTWTPRDVAPRRDRWRCGHGGRFRIADEVTCLSIKPCERSSPAGQ